MPCAPGGSVSCWGDDSAGRLPVKPGTYVSISSGGTHSCGLDSSGAFPCRGNDAIGQASSPSGNYASADAGFEDSCAIDFAGELVCWGGGDTTGLSSVPSGSFTKVSVSDLQGFGCAIDTFAAIQCWVTLNFGLVPSPVRGSHFFWGPVLYSRAAHSSESAAVGSDTLMVCIPMARAGFRFCPRSSRKTTSLARTPISSRVRV